MARPLAFWNAVGSALLVHALLVLNAVYYPNLWAFKVAVVDMVNEVRGWDPTAFTPAGTPRVEKKRKARREKTQEDYAYVVPLNVDEHFTVLPISDDLCRCCPEASSSWRSTRSAAAPSRGASTTPAIMPSAGLEPWVGMWSTPETSHTFCIVSPGFRFRS